MAPSVSHSKMLAIKISLSNAEKPYSRLKDEKLDKLPIPTTFPL